MLRLLRPLIFRHIIRFTVLMIRHYCFRLLRQVLRHHHPGLTQSIHGHAVDQPGALVSQQGRNPLALQTPLHDLGLQVVAAEHRHQLRTLSHFCRLPQCLSGTLEHYVHRSILARPQFKRGCPLMDQHGQPSQRLRPGLPGFPQERRLFRIIHQVIDEGILWNQVRRPTGSLSLSRCISCQWTCSSPANRNPGAPRSSPVPPREDADNPIPPADLANELTSALPLSRDRLNTVTDVTSSLSSENTTALATPPAPSTTALLLRKR